MRVPCLLAAAAVAVAACATTPPPSATAPLQTSSLLGPTVAPVMPIGATILPPAQPPVGLFPMPPWPGGGIGLPGFGSVYELTTFLGPESTMPGPRTLQASGGEYDSCANDYTAKVQVTAGSGGNREIRLSVSVSPANRQCFASGYEQSHTFEFPVRLDTSGTYAVMSQTAYGDYRRIGTITVGNGTIDPGPGNGQFIYEFSRFDGPNTVQRGVTATVKATGGDYDFCGASFSAKAAIDTQARTLDLTMIGTPLPPDQPRCMALAASSHTEPFDVRFTETGLYTVRTQSASGWKPIGSIAVN